MDTHNIILLLLMITHSVCFFRRSAFSEYQQQAFCEEIRKHINIG